MSLLGELAQVLDRLAALLADGRAAFDSDPRQGWSIERLWIYAGNLAEAHCRAEGIDDGVDPWSELISARNVYAHYRPSQIVPGRLWADTVEAIDRLRQAVGQPEA